MLRTTTCLWLSVLPVASITTPWEFLDGGLLWENSIFITGGKAGFCRQIDGGGSYAAFNEGEARWHAGCEAVKLSARLGRYSGNSIALCVRADDWSSASTCPGLYPDPAGEWFPGNATLILPQNVYFPYAVPTDEFCIPVMESWMIGQCTILPPTNASGSAWPVADPGPLLECSARQPVIFCVGKQKMGVSAGSDRSEH